MVNEVASIERRWVVVVMAVGLMISFTACGGETSIAASPSDEAAGDPSMSMTASPPDEDAPTYAGCQDLSKVFDSRDENQLSYLPEEHWLIVSPSRGVYKIDLVNDTGCIEANPALAKSVAQFQSQQRYEQRSECRATLHQLKTGDFAAGEKAIDPEALHQYAVSICQPLGIAVPGR
jgi:hypothetical protein